MYIPIRCLKMTEYIRTPICEISSPKLWSTMIYKSVDKAMAKVNALFEEYYGEDEYPITINYFPNGRIAKGFNEDTQSIEDTPTENVNETSWPTDEDVVAFKQYISKLPFMTPHLQEMLDSAFEFFGKDTIYIMVTYALNDIEMMKSMAPADEGNQ